MRRFSSLKKYLFVLTGIFLATMTYGQKEVRMYEKGQENFEAHDYQEALSYFREVAEIDPQYQDLPYKLEICTLLTGDGDDTSLDDFLAMEAEYGESDDHYYYWLGQMYIRRYQIGKATDAFEKFHQRMAYSGGVDEEYSNQLVAHSQQLKFYFENPDDFEIHQLESPINSPAAELSPVFFEDKDELLFASDRSGNGEVPFSIYFSRNVNEGWEVPVKVTNLGYFTRENANIEVVNEDGKLFIFKEEKGGDLFYSQPSGTNWTVPVEFDARVSNNHLASHFFINEHEDRIIFASDEGDDGLDIYESFRDPESQKWSRPKPFYSVINSSFNEDSPYLSPDENTLYFSSDRPGGVGGYDVYVSYYDPAQYVWSEPENMGWPINSPNDEIHFKMNPDQSSGYFSSNRLHTLGDFDIYFFWHVEKVKIAGRIFNESEGKALGNGEIRFHPSQYLDEYFGSSIDATGRYSTNIISDEIFKVEIIVDGSVIHEEKFEIHETNGEPITHIKDFSIR